MLRVKSRVDVITNSSTECFAMRNSKTERKIKDLVDSLLRLGGDHSHTFDDYFEFRRTVNRECMLDYIDNGFVNETDVPSDKSTDEELLKWAMKYNDEYDDHAPWYDIGISVIAKDPLNKRLAEILSSLDQFFDLIYTSAY